MGGVALGAVGVLTLGSVLPRAAEVTAAAAAPAVAGPAFVAHAVGTVARATGWQDRPGGEGGAATVPAGTALRIGGRVRVPAGLGTRDLLWVGIADESGQRYGFIAADDVVLSAGELPLLALDGLPPEALLSPEDGARQGHGAAEPGGAAAAGDAGGVSASSAARGPLAGLSGADRVDLPWLPETVSRWSELLNAAGAKHGVDPNLLAILVLVESGGNPGAVSPAGATGLMQIMPGTAAGIAQQLGVAGHATARLYEPAYNIDFGAYYISQQLKAFGKTGDPDWQRSVELAASAYNGGPGTVQRYLGGGTLPAETRSYQRWVGGMWRERRESAPATFDAWMSAGGRVLVERARQAA